MPTRYARYVLPILGLILVGSLLIMVITDIEYNIPQILTLVLVFAVGPVAIVGILGLSDLLADHGGSFPIRVGTVFLVIAFACFTMMLVVQQLGQMSYADIRSSIATDQQGTLSLIYRSFNWVQLGMDVTFDIFFGIGVIIYAVIMCSHLDFGKIIGITGVLMAVYLLVSNMWAFPNTPKSAGIMDPAPIALIWWLAVIVRIQQVKRRYRRLSGSTPAK